MTIENIWNFLQLNVIVEMYNFKNNIKIMYINK